jgi:hypothetical protein
MSESKESAEEHPTEAVQAEQGDAEQREALRQELSSLLSELGADSLSFLKEQAEVLRHNERIRAAKRRQRESSAESGERKAEEEKRPREADEQTQAAEPDEISIVRRDEQSFFVYVGKQRAFFNREEMRQLARIAHAAEDGRRAAPRLYRWFERERLDFLRDMGIASRNSGVLQQLYEIIVSTYTVKSG